MFSLVNSQIAETFTLDEITAILKKNNKFLLFHFNILKTY